MKNLCTQKEIMAGWKKNTQAPIISICCTAYNHERYIEDTLEGFLIQETEFPFEILIHDDASTDKTADIIREYEIKYPQIIKAIYQTENQYSKGKKPTFDIIFPRAKGKYIAFCEGDDYWVDRLKLQIQTEFLEKNKEYVMSGTDAIIVDDDNNLIHDSKLSHMLNRDIVECPEIGNDWTLTMSIVFRNIISEWPPELYRVLSGDLFVQTFLLGYGKRKFHPEIQKCVYRVHSGGIWSTLDQKKKIDNNLKTHIWLYKYFSRTGKKEQKSQELRVIFYWVLKACEVRMPFSAVFKKLYKNIKSRKVG